MAQLAAASVPVAVVEILNDLLDAELNSVFRFMGEGSPYLSRATVEVRRPLAEMVSAGNRRAGELHSMIESVGGTAHHRGLQPEEQYLAYLSLKFLLPKLVDVKKLAIRRYETALLGIQKVPGAAVAIIDMLSAHLAEQRRELATLELAVTGARRRAS